MIQEVINFLVSLGMCTYLFPEMKLSIATDKPVAIRYTADDHPRRRRYTTFLTGSIDYLAFNCDLNTQVNSERISAAKRQEILSQRTLSSLTNPDNGPLSTTFLNCLRFLHVEAKRDKENQKLKDCRAQAIAETLAT